MWGAATAEGGAGSLVINVVLVAEQCELGIESEVCCFKQKRVLERVSSFFIVKGENYCKNSFT